MSVRGELGEFFRRSRKAKKRGRETQSESALLTAHNQDVPRDYIVVLAVAQSCTGFAT
jgi:hypothetical protein